MAPQKSFADDARDAFDLDRTPKKEPSKEPALKETKKADPAPAQAKEAEQVSVTPQAKEGGEELIRRTFYITKAQYKALKIRSVESERPEDKDSSAIVRTAIDLYLAEQL
jgi:hypothetical protein